MKTTLVEKEPGSDLKKHYGVIFQLSLAVVLGLCITAFSINMIGNQKSEKDQYEPEKQETIAIKDVVRTVHKDQPPQPPSPQVPVEVPNDQIIEGKAQQTLDALDQQISSGKKLSLPPPPEKEKDTEKVFRIVEKQPKLIGGLDTLRSMINYPKLAKQAGIEGRVYVEFIVNKKGEVKDPKVIRGPGAGLNKEALRVIKKAQFRPGIQQGHPVNVKLTMPIIFQLDRMQS